MPVATFLTPHYAVSEQLMVDDFSLAAKNGFRSVLNLRPDGEAANQPSTNEAAHLAGAAGLHYAAIPVTKFDVFADDLVSAAQAALRGLAPPVLAYCASGQRAAIIWAAATARTEPVSDVLAALTSAGFRFDFLRDDLEQQAGRSQWADISGAPQTADTPTQPLPGPRASDREAA